MPRPYYYPRIITIEEWEFKIFWHEGYREWRMEIYFWYTGYIYGNVVMNG